MVTSDEIKVLKVNDYKYSIDFGNKEGGSDIHATVRYEGSKILRVGSSCGCTTPTVDFNSGEVTIKYNSNKKGVIRQVVTLYLQSGEEVKINVLGYVN